MSHPDDGTVSPTPPRPGPAGFIPVLPRQDRAAYAYPGTGGTGRALADAARNDALMHLIATADEAARNARLPLGVSNDLLEAASRARLVFGLS